MQRVRSEPLIGSIAEDFRFKSEPDESEAFMTGTFPPRCVHAQPGAGRLPTLRLRPKKNLKLGDRIAFVTG